MADIELQKAWWLLKPGFRKIAKEYKKRYGFIWTNEAPKK